MDRTGAVLRGMQFIYGNAREGDNFDYWGGDYLWCFHTIAATCADGEVRAEAARMGAQLAGDWLRAQPQQPAVADAGEAAYYISMIDVANRLGVDEAAVREHIRRESRRFTAREYLGFDPLTEPPSGEGRSRYDVWLDALVLTYTGDGCGMPMGASYADVLQWLPAMRPYHGPDGGANPEFRDTVLAVTHLVYTLNDYNRYRLRPEWLPIEVRFLRENLKEPLAAGDPELLGEFVDCLRAFGLEESDPRVKAGTGYLLESQNPDGSWGDPNSSDVHARYHTTWTAIDALRSYCWRERTEWPAGVAAILNL